MTNSNFSASYSVDCHLLDNRYAIELVGIQESGMSAYDQRSAKVVLDRKYATVKEALVGLYDMGIQHSCNLRELLEEYSTIA